MKLFFREIDIIDPWGGEEFIIILKKFSVADLLAKAEQLRFSIEELKINLNDISTSIPISTGILFLLE